MTEGSGGVLARSGGKRWRAVEACLPEWRLAMESSGGVCLQVRRLVMENSQGVLARAEVSDGE
jgi:hypothetical protein